MRAFKKYVILSVVEGLYIRIANQAPKFKIT